VAYVYDLNGLSYKKDTKSNLSFAKKWTRSNPLPGIGFFTYITDPLLIDGTDTISINTGYALGEIDLRSLFFYWFSTLTAIMASLKRLFSALLTVNQRQGLTTMRALHLFLLNKKTSYKSIDIPFVSSQFIKELLGPLIGEKAIQIIALFRKEGVEIDLSTLLLFLLNFLGLFVILVHKSFSLYRTAILFCQPLLILICD